MALYLDMNALSTGSLSVVKTDNGKPAYILTARHGIINGGFDLNTLSGNPLGSIRQKTVSVFPRYDLYIADRNDFIHRDTPLLGISFNGITLLCFNIVNFNVVGRT